MTTPTRPTDGRAPRVVPGEAPSPDVDVRLLGTFRLRADGSPVELPAGAQRLVALLALRGRTSRSRLAGTLWPETSEHRALASLRTGIWRVNQAADGMIACTPGTVDLEPGADVDVRRLVRDARAAMRLGEPGVPGGAEATAELLEDSGELLPDWDDDWLLPDRERLRQMRMHVLEAVAGRLSASGRRGMALEAALASLRIDPLRESAHRAVIGIHLAEGNVAEARRAYAHCRLVLVRDVGVEPSPATSRLLTSVGPPTAADVAAGVVLVSRADATPVAARSVS